MANKVYVGNAAAVKQIVNIEVGGTWAGTETPTLTINGKDLTVTLDTDVLTANVAELLKNAWNANSRLDGTATLDGTSNFGGQEFGEFSEVTASIDPDDSDILVLTANRAGVPFTVTATDNSTSGTFTLTTPQAATGPNHWDNADNWQTEGGGGTTVPANGDTVIFRDSTVSVKYGLPASILNVTFVVYQSFSGQIGLPEVNTENASKPYDEYRARYVSIGDDGATDDANTHIFGLGEGVGSPLINITQVNQDTTPNGLTTSAVIYNTGTPQISGKKALNLLINNEGLPGGSITVNKGSVHLGFIDSSNKSQYATLNVNYTTSQASDANVSLENHVGNLTINQNGGTLLIAEPGTQSLTGNRTLNISGGLCTIRDLSTSGTVNCTLLNSRIIYNATKTIAALIVGTGATFDAEKDSRAFTITDCDLYQGASLLDEFARGTYTNGIDLNRCGIDDVTIRVGNNRRLTLGTAA